jgi:hypothetical protein
MEDQSHDIVPTKTIKIAVDVAIAAIIYGGCVEVIVGGTLKEVNYTHQARVLNRS